VEPITHGLVSLAIARVAQSRLPRYGTYMLIVSGVAADLDYASYLGGPGAFLNLHRALFHSAIGSVALIAIVAAAFCFLDRKRPSKNPGPPLAFAAGCAVSAIGVACHLALDFCNGESVQLFWPLKIASAAWNLTQSLDPWILFLLLAGLLLPHLFRLVSDEIGERKRGAVGGKGALIALILLVGYLGGRAYLHSRAVDLLLSREFHRRDPLAAGAFPSATAPFSWRGVVTTDNTIEEVELSVAPGAEFDPDRSLTHYKPEASAALDAGEGTASARKFLAYARFPLASVTHLEDGFRFELRDMQFASGDSSPADIFVRVDLDSSLRVREEGFRFASSPNP
jgi:inner membrane protein